MAGINVIRENQVCQIIIDRPDKKNALTQEMYHLMADAINKSEQDENCRVILIKGQGSCFTAGNDMQDFAQSIKPDSVSINNLFMDALFHCKLPVVAQVHGMAIGIGTTLLLHCDIVICSEDSRFSMPFVDLALVPEFASSYILPKLAGHRKASKWLLLGDTFGAHEAEKFGLVTTVVNSDILSAEAESITARLVAKPKKALLKTKALMKPDSSTILKHMQDELAVFVEQLSTSSAKEAFNAFLEKRSPNRAIYK